MNARERARGFGRGGLHLPFTPLDRAATESLRGLLARPAFAENGGSNI